jgi:eukaryotic-like serine/threonine-protein kinase
VALSAGSHVGSYEIVELIGGGGTGEVYRARDTKLNREVAIKVLLPALANDPDRLARFDREAEILASLDHPGIARIYGLEDVDGVRALVMELVEGPTLAERAARGPLPLAETLQIAQRVAEAVEAAHEQGIVHRDLKPANIKLRPDGAVKVLDFGLAKAFDPIASGNDATSSPTTLTEAGLILGTAAYMSPEQARGKPVDRRTDVWAFGCIVYELLTGVRAFGGETMSDTLAAVIEREPDWTRLPPGTPGAILRLLRRTIDKNPARRLHDIADARIEIEDAIAGGRTPDRIAARASKRWNRAFIGATILLAGVVLGFVAASRRSTGMQAFKFVPFAAERIQQLSPAWSRDGKNLAYLAEVDGIREVFVRSLDAAVPTQITKSATSCSSPLWSPDGTRVYYIANSTLSYVGAAGGSPQLVLQDAGAASIAPDGAAFAILRGAGGNRTLWIAPARGEPYQYKTPPFPERFTRSDSIAFAPDGSKIAVLIEQQTGPSLSFELWVVPYPSGPPRRALGPLPSSSGPIGFGRISWAADSRHIVLQNAFPDEPSHLYVVDATAGSIRPLTSGTGEEWTPAVSPDGTRVAFASGTDDFDIVQVSMDGADVRSLLATGRSEQAPEWSPDGSRFAYITNMHGRQELWLHGEHDVWSTPVLKRDMEGLPTWYFLERPAFSPDGQKIAYGVILGTQHAIWISPVTGGRPIPIDRESPDQHGPAWSPDGNWIAYQRLRNDQWELVKAPLGGDKPIRLAEATPGGGWTAWSRTGKWIAHAREGAIQLVSPDGGPERSVGASSSGAFEFSRDDAHLFALRRSATQNWELADIDVRSGEEKSVKEVRVRSTATLSGFSLHPDGKSFLTAVGTARFDVWILEGFTPSGR